MMFGVRLRHALVLLVALAPICIQVGGAHARGPERIAGGFTVADGSRLLGGTVFPYVRERNFRGAEDGWTAMLAVTGSAGTVYDEYAKQARALGLNVEWSDKACQVDAAANIRCAGGDVSGPARLVIDLRVCSDCSPVTSLMRIDGQGVGKGGAPIPGVPPAPDSRFDVRVSPQQRRATRQPRPGELLGPDSNLRVPSGSTVLATGDIAGCGTGSNNAVIKVADDPKAVYERYAAKMRLIDPVRTVNGRIDGKPASEARNAYTAVGMVERDDGTAVLASSECKDD
jgi:hypothetical protein